MHFLLRDFGGKIVPGFAVLVATVTAADAFGIHPFKAPYVGAFGWVLLAGAAWLTGLAIQNIVEFARWPMNTPLQRKDMATWMKAMANASPHELTGHERCVVLKESSRNAGTAIVVCVTLLGIAGFGRPQIVPSTTAAWAFLIAISILAAALLFWQSYKSHQAQVSMEDALLARTAPATMPAPASAAATIGPAT